MLNEQQKAAAFTTEPNVLVISGPGSGKTKTVTERVAYLVEECKVSCYEVACITFTRNASREMQERLVSRLGFQAYKASIKTLHSMALSLINKHCEMAGLRSPITVYSEFEEQFLLKQIARELGMYTGKTWKIKKKDIDKYFNYQYQGTKPTGFIPDERICELWNVFQGRIRENNSLTFGALLLELANILPNIKQWLPFKHILVDEVQDIDLLQWQIINSMKELLNANLFAVGDISQAIFEWRGAAPGYLIEHINDFQVYRLSTNYRSNAPIVEACNQLITHNELRIDNPMQATTDGPGWALLPNTDSVRLATHLDDLAYSPDAALSNIAVLARNHVLLQKLSQELELRKVPFQYLGRKSKLKDTELFRRFHAFLKLLVNPYDNFSFLLIKDLIGVSDDDYQAIRTQAAELGESHFTVWKHKTANNFTDFFNFKLNHDHLSYATFNIQYMATGAHPYPSQGWGWSTEEVLEITRFIFSYINQNPEAHILSYLNWLATYDVQDEIENQEAITLATIHGAKGLEWPIVFVYGLNEGLLPSKQAIASGDIEAERRLAYVAMSRAETLLRLVVRPEQSEGKDGKMYLNPMSRFVIETEEPETVEV